MIREVVARDTFMTLLVKTIEADDYRNWGKPRHLCFVHDEAVGHSCNIVANGAMQTFII